MSSTITLFPVGNGDMTLIALGDTAQTKILIDCNIRGSADDPDDPTRDVAADLRRRLRRDPRGRPYVDAFLLSHPDQDQCARRLPRRPEARCRKTHCDPGDLVFSDGVSPCRQEPCAL